MARDLVVRIVGDSSSLERAFRRSERAGRQFEASFTGRIKNAAGAYKGFAAAVGAGAVIAGLKSTFDAASDLNEEISKSEQVFGDSAAEILAWSETASEALKLSRTEALAFSSGIGAMLRTAGVAGPQIGEMSRRLVQLGADMASFNNQDPSEMLARLQGGLAGEAEPLRRFGVLLSEARVQTEAYRTGLARQGAKLTEQQKVLARYAIILKDTARQQGDVARTGDQAAGQQRELRARIADLQAEIGGKLLPAYAEVLTATNEMIGSVGKLGDAFDKLGGNRLKDALDRTIGRLPALAKAFSPLGPAAFLFNPPTKPVLNLANAWDAVGSAITGAARNLDPFRKALADINEAFQAAATKFGPKPIPGAQQQTPFELPGTLRLAQARAEVTGAAADDVLVAQRIKAFIEDRIAAGKLKGQRLIDALGALGAAQGVIESAMQTEASKRREAAEKEATARRKHADALKKTAERLVQETDRFRQQIGDLFAPLPDTVLRAQRRAELGLPGPDPRQLVTGLREQTAAFEANQRNLRRLRRAGAPGRLIDELQGRGLEVAPQVAALAGASRQIQRQFFAAFRRREEAARKAAERPININVRVFLDDRDITTRVITRAQRTARHQGKQRRGRHGGAAMGLA